MEYVIIDLEWNQVYSKQAANLPIKSAGEVIQIGAVKLNDGFEQIDSFQILVNPVHIKKLHRGVAKITKLTDELLDEQGLSFPEAFANFIHWCGNDFIILTWGTDDVPVFKINMQAYGIDPALLPKWYDLQLIYDWQIGHEGRQCALADAVEKIGGEYFDAHDALNDARMTAQVCAHLDVIGGIEIYSEKLLERTKLQHKKRNAKQKERRKRKKLTTAVQLSIDDGVYTIRLPGSFESRTEAIHSEAASQFYVSGLKTTILAEEWIFESQNKYTSVGIDMNADEYTLRLKLKPDKTGAGKWRAVVTVRPVGEVYNETD
ncbi:MAG: exonuclease domain-containing protein [Clostridia bacterium]|nr:exonuclease domain-containing protein [Clostridia bacterium]